MTNPLTTGYTATVFYNGIASDSTTTTSTTVEATFDLALPVSSEILSPTLKFTLDGTHQAHYAENTLTLDNTFDTNDVTTSSVTCSFAGGCEMTLGLTGLAKTVIKDVAKVTVCGRECEVDEV